LTAETASIALVIWAMFFVDLMRFLIALLDAMF
jgi:hypothetical protein